MSEGKSTQSNTTRAGWRPGMPEPRDDAPLPGEQPPGGAAAPRPAASRGADAAGTGRGGAGRPAGPAAQEAPRPDNLDVILDIPVTLTMELGRARIPIRTLMQLNQGSVVELERMAGEPLDVLVNGLLIAHGEVVVVNERFGIRFTDVVSPAERAQTLR
jgi:flagellar motor switch protein FliN/FliY